MPTLAFGSIPARAADELNVAYFLEWATPNLIAKAEGLYDEALGVPVNWVPYDTGVEMTDAMLSGEVDIAYSQGLAPFIAGVNAGAPLVTVGVAVEYPTAPCIVADDLGISASNASELAGKRVAVPVATMSDYSLRMQMDTLGVDVESLTVIDQVPADATKSLINGDVDMACIFGGNSVRQALEVGNALMSEQALLDADVISFDVISATEEFVRDNPDQIEAFLNVTNKINKVFARDQNRLDVVAQESGMDSPTTRSMMDSMIYPTIEDQLIIYFNKAGLVQSAIELVGDAFATRENPARRDYDAVIDTSFLK